MKSLSNAHYKVGEVADILGLSHRYVQKLVADGEIGSRLFGRARRIGEDQVQDYLRRNTCGVQGNQNSPCETAHIMSNTTMAKGGAGSAPERKIMKLPYMP